MLIFIIQLQQKTEINLLNYLFSKGQKVSSAIWKTRFGEHGQLPLPSWWLCFWDAYSRRVQVLPVIHLGQCPSAIWAITYSFKKKIWRPSCRIELSCSGRGLRWFCAHWYYYCSAQSSVQQLGPACCQRMEEWCSGQAVGQEKVPCKLRCHLGWGSKWQAG